MEPIWNTETELSNVLNWYSYHKTKDDATKYFYEYLHHNNIDIADLYSKYASKIYFNSSIAWVCRQKMLGVVFPKTIDTKIDQLIIQIREKLIELKEIFVPEEIEPKDTPNIQDRMREQLKFYLSEIDGKIDEFILSDFQNNNFSLYDFLSDNDVKPIQTNKIIENYTKQSEELKLAFRGKDADLKEAYEIFTKKEMRKYIEFVEKLCQDGKTWADTAKVISKQNRKPRKKKEKPAGVLVQKMKYQKEFPEMGLKSILPSTIIKASQLWTYNTKTKIASIYICDNDHGLSVRGTTIINFDETISESKTLRNPKESIQEIMKIGKIASKKFLKTLSTKTKQPSGRINEDTILLRVLK